MFPKFIQNQPRRPLGSLLGLLEGLLRATKNHPKINQKTTKNLYKIYQKSTKNGPPEGPGRPLGGFQRLLGPSWNEFESQDGSKVDLGALLGGSGRLLGPSWSETEGQDGSKLGPKKEVLGIQKRSENGCIIGTLLGSTFSWILDRFWEAKWTQVGIKMECNIDWAVIAENLKII